METPGQFSVAINTYVDTLGNRTCANGQILKFQSGTWQCAGDNSGGGADNLGSHTATQNINLNGKWLSGNGDNKGIYISANGNVGIGTSTPATALQILGTGGENDDISLTSNHNNTSTAGAIHFYRSRGTAAAPSAVNTNDSLGWVRAHGYDGTGYFAAADMRFFASQNWATNRSAYITFGTLNNGVYGERMRITAEGDVRIPGGNLHMGGNAIEGVGHIAVTAVAGGSTHGITARANVTNGHALYGSSNASAGYGVTGEVTGQGSAGVFGWASSASGRGVEGGANGASGYGILCRSINNASGCGGNRAWTNTSDIRLKHHISDLSAQDGLSAIMRLRPVTYQWRTEKSGRTELGFIAQEVEEIMPELVGTSPDTTVTLDDGSEQKITDVKSLSYSGFVVPLVKAVQELKAENDALRADNDNFRRELDELKSAIGK